jgi:hypothetical protein
VPILQPPHTLLCTHGLFWLNAKWPNQELTPEMSCNFLTHPNAVAQWGLIIGWQGILKTPILTGLESFCQSGMQNYDLSRLMEVSWYFLIILDIDQNYFEFYIRGLM